MVPPFCSTARCLLLLCFFFYGLPPPGGASAQDKEGNGGDGPIDWAISSTEGAHKDVSNQLRVTETGPPDSFTTEAKIKPPSAPSPAIVTTLSSSITAVEKGKKKEEEEEEGEEKKYEKKERAEEEKSQPVIPSPEGDHRGEEKRKKSSSAGEENRRRRTEPNSKNDDDDDDDDDTRYRQRNITRNHDITPEQHTTQTDWPKESVVSSPEVDPIPVGEFPSEIRKTFPDLPVPILPPSYAVELDVWDGVDKEAFFVKEEESEETQAARLTLRADTLNVTCIFNTHTSHGYLVEGVMCGRNSDLPKKCFCTERFCRPYVVLGALLQALRANGATLRKQSLGGEGGLELWAWHATVGGSTSLEAVYSTTTMKRRPNDDVVDAAADLLPPTYDQLTPISFTVKGSESGGLVLGGGPVWLQYRVMGWSPGAATPRGDLMATPPGVYCPTSERKALPRVANQFSITMETVIENLETLAYERQHYESEEKLVSFTYRPHLHADGMFLLNIPGLLSSGLSLESYRVVHDFKTGIQYMLNEKTQNCSMQGIPLSALDAAPTDSQHIRLRHASELISINPNVFIYKGQRRVRGAICDVWVAERGVTQGRYSTVEVFFSHENWTVEIEVFNKVRQVPIGISTYVADANSPSRWTSKVHTFFYEYSEGHPSWSHFDISPCLSRINRVFLQICLEVSYAELVHYNLDLAKNSIRRAIAGIAGVSPLRITDLFLRSRQSTGEVEVWFVLLEKPSLSSSSLSSSSVLHSPRPQLLMADAYKLLHDITHKHNVSVKLELSPTKKQFVTIRRGSLETSSDLLHPRSSRGHSSRVGGLGGRFLKAGYTAGSMAGLGFSMAILGTCVGVFVGFLLWKRSSPNVPYRITH